jgi:hypothetical protein
VTGGRPGEHMPGADVPVAEIACNDLLLVNALVIRITGAPQPGNYWFGEVFEPGVALPWAAEDGRRQGGRMIRRESDTVRRLPRPDLAEGDQVQLAAADHLLRIIGLGPGLPGVIMWAERDGSARVRFEAANVTISLDADRARLLRRTDGAS